MQEAVQRVSVIDSHTGGEPTRLVVSGGPPLEGETLAERARDFSSRHDRFRSAVVNEPRGSDVLVGALLVSAVDPTCAAGVIFFNNVGLLGMCGHGMMGVAATLVATGRLAPGRHRIETPVGIVTVTASGAGEVAVENVASWRAAANVEVALGDGRRVRGDVAWGGNWFFLVPDPPCPLARAHLDALTEFSREVRTAVNAGGHPEVDHIELVGPPTGARAHARNFVLCPGHAYDRSPCGTGTSAKVACLAADGRLAEGEEWVQEGILGSSFSARYRWLDRAAGRIIPTVAGSAHLTAESVLIIDPRDPFCWGIRQSGHE